MTPVGAETTLSLWCLLSQAHTGLRRVVQVASLRSLPNFW
jgi:hypothetical protein